MVGGSGVQDPSLQVPVLRNVDGGEDLGLHDLNASRRWWCKGVVDACVEH
jgi:hypothetical protein